MPGTVSAKPTRSPKKKPVAKSTDDTSLNAQNSVQNSNERAGDTPLQGENSPLEEIGAGENAIETPLTESLGGSRNKAKRGSGV